MSFALIPSVEIVGEKIAHIPIFQTLNAFVCSKCSFSNKNNLFANRFFLDQSWLEQNIVFIIFGTYTTFFLKFIHHLSKFGKFLLKIGGEIICQSRLLLTPFFNLTIVQWVTRSHIELFWTAENTKDSFLQVLSPPQTIQTITLTICKRGK